MQTYIVIVSGNILNVSTVHLNGIWHLIWHYLSKPVLGGHPVLSWHYSIPRGCPLNTGFTVFDILFFAIIQIRINFFFSFRYEYKMAREYNWNVKNKATKGYEVWS